MPAGKETRRESKPKKSAAPKALAKRAEPVEEMKECGHCEGVGKCVAGEPYDKGHHQVFGAKMIMTSCQDCLDAAGEHRNSKKLVKCRICGGAGKVAP